jgi:hypothetical protein
MYESQTKFICQTSAEQCHGPHILWGFFLMSARNTKFTLKNDKWFFVQIERWTSPVIEHVRIN